MKQYELSRVPGSNIFGKRIPISTIEETCDRLEAGQYNVVTRKDNGEIGRYNPVSFNAFQ